MVSEEYYITERCGKCGACTYSCPKHCIIVNKDRAYIDLTKCTACGKCVDSCSLLAIKKRDQNDK